MKKLFVMIVAVCLLAGVLCTTALAADGTVLSVSALKKDGTTVLINDYADFAEGWTAAMAMAYDKKLMKNNDYDRIVVDLYADWNAKNGIFGTDAKGFRWGTRWITILWLPRACHGERSRG